jgi:hypothetical protein
MYLILKSDLNSRGSAQVRRSRLPPQGCHPVAPCGQPGGGLQPSNNITLLLTSSNHVTSFLGDVKSRNYIVGVVQSRPPTAWCS